MTSPTSSDAFIPARRVWERYGVSFMTINRWVTDERMAFPPPVYLGRFRYWRMADLEAWERNRVLAGKPAKAA